MKKKLLAILSVLLLVVAPMLRAGGQENDAKKLDKELKKISLTAAVTDGRRVVNRVMAEQLGVSRKQLVQERKQTGLVYGDLFAAHEVARVAKIAFSQVVQEIDEGQGVAEIGEKHHVELKAILTEAKKLNKRIDGELDRIANGDEDEDAQDDADSYDPSEDSVNPDTSDFTPSQIAQANSRVHNRGGQLTQGGPGSGSGSGAATNGAPGAGKNPGRGRGHP